MFAVRNKLRFKFCEFEPTNFKFHVIYFTSRCWLVRMLKSTERKVIIAVFWLNSETPAGFKMIKNDKQIAANDISSSDRRWWWYEDDYDVLWRFTLWLWSFIFRSVSVWIWTCLFLSSRADGGMEGKEREQTQTCPSVLCLYIDSFTVIKWWNCDSSFCLNLLKSVFFLI